AKNGLTQTGAGKHNFHLPQVAFTAPAGTLVLRRPVLFLTLPQRVRGRFEVAYLTGFAPEKQGFFLSSPTASLQERTELEQASGVIHAEQEWRLSLSSRLFKDSGNTADPEPDRGAEAFLRPLPADG